MLEDSVYKKIRASHTCVQKATIINILDGKTDIVVRLSLRRSCSVLDEGYILDGQRDAHSVSFPIVRPENGPLEFEKRVQ